jgi:hypothetical protein
MNRCRAVDHVRLCWACVGPVPASSESAALSSKGLLSRDRLYDIRYLLTKGRRLMARVSQQISQLEFVAQHSERLYLNEARTRDPDLPE